MTISRVQNVEKFSALDISLNSSLYYDSKYENNFCSNFSFTKIVSGNIKSIINIPEPKKHVLHI